MDLWMTLAFVSGFVAVGYFFYRVSLNIAFREFFIMLYAVNYLLSPAIIYSLPKGLVYYSMKIPSATYFPIAFAGILSLIAGLFSLSVKELFKPNIQLIQIEALLNESVLKKWAVGGMLVGIIVPFMPAELGFAVYLISLIRYIGAFGLFAIDAKKNKWYIIAVLGYQFLLSLKEGMFHDFMMWLVFFGIFFIYLKRLTLGIKVLLFAAGVLLFSIIQNTKGSYRTAISSNDNAGLSTFIQVAQAGVEQSSETSYWQSSNFIASITRINQAWIFASTIENMDHFKNFQGLNNVQEYVKSALLPRVLAPDKLQSGDKEIFNKFSGHTIRAGTSMGLGIFADGYIAYGFWGVVIFGFILGFIFSLIFRILQGWTMVSPFYFLFMFPILNYAVRPDCEVQTILGHIVKSVFLYALIVAYYSNYFKKKLLLLSQALEEQEKQSALYQ